MDKLILSIIFFFYPKPLPRVLISQYISLLPNCDMCINLCDVNRAVSEHFLNVADVDIGFQEAGGEGVAEHVRGDVQVDGGEGAVFVNHAANGLVGQGSAGLIHKKMCRGAYFGGKAAAVFIENVDNVIGGKLYVALLVTFSIYEDSSVDKVHVIIFQIAELTYSYAGGE